jgi:hypothetical protein
MTNANVGQRLSNFSVQAKTRERTRTVFAVDIRLRAVAVSLPRGAYCRQVEGMTPEARIKALRAAPPDGWAAFSSDEESVVAYGKSYDEVVARAEENGEPDPVVVKVPSDWSMRVLSP